MVQDPSLIFVEFEVDGNMGYTSLYLEDVNLVMSNNPIQHFISKNIIYLSGRE